MATGHNVFIMTQVVLYRYVPDAESEEAQLLISTHECESIIQKRYNDPMAGQYGAKGFILENIEIRYLNRFATITRERIEQQQDQWKQQYLTRNGDKHFALLVTKFEPLYISLVSQKLKDFKVHAKVRWAILDLHSLPPYYLIASLDTPLNQIAMYHSSTLIPVRDMELYQFSPKREVVHQNVL
ncbi:hypothetical protein CDAR_446171 [Caerostris darwini]|uniref:Uncharacterized protein n=1 Tax=Caerostris darwini TaxID=1538125 RepID=A0AAV4U8T6_9ARAC|nr:hypothetical protein CDAR_446171 [Caerostris darwini]